MIKELIINTSNRTEFIDITSQIQNVVRDTGMIEGTAIIFVPHTTAAITINENADPDVQRDMIKELNKIVPFDDNYAHFEGNSAAHIKASLMGFSETIIIHNGRLLLGAWQGVYLCEFDGKRKRKVIIKLCEK